MKPPALILAPLLALTTSAAIAATGDPTVTIRADGYSCEVYVEGFTTGATITTGHTGSYNAISADTPFFTVVSKGFTSTGSATTTTRTVYLGTPMRKPYPDNASRDEDTSSVPGSVRIRFSLSEPIYAKDDTGAGNSGTAPTFTAPAGFIVNTGGASQNSTATTAAAVVTNDSALAYPKVIGQWDWRTTGQFRRKTADFTAGFRATHAFGIAGVRIDADGVTSAANVNDTMTAVSKIGAMQNGLYYDAYKTTVPLSGFTQGEQIRLRARVWPTVGDTSEDIDTEDTTGLTQAGNGRIEVTCDKTGGLVSYAVVKTAAAGGNDTTGATSGTLGTAEGTPYATVAEAINDDASVIYLTDDDTATHAFTQTPVKSPAYQIEIRPHPSDVAANITLSVSSAAQNARCKNLYIGGGINVNLGAALNYIDGNTGTYNSTITIDGVTWDGTSGSSRGNLWRWGLATFINCDLNEYNLGSGADHFGWSAMGCTLGASVDETIEEWGCLVACDQGTEKKITMTAGNTSNPGHLTQNFMFEFNRFDRLNPTTSASLWSWDAGNLVGNFSMRGNVLINSGTSESDSFFFNSIASDNLLVRHNTIQGFPHAANYNDTGTVAIAKTNLFYSGNAFYRLSTKTDIFDADGAGTTHAPNGNRVGNWWFVFGCGMRDNRVDGSVSFLPEWPGVNSGLVGDAADYTDLGYTDDNSRIGDGTGGGDYTPTSGSVLRNAMNVSGAFIAFDLHGTAIPSSGTMDVGAWINATAPPVGASATANTGTATTVTVQ